MNELKIDLALLNKLVKELNDEFGKAESQKDGDGYTKHDYVAAVAKCLGLTNAIALESTALTHDYYKEIKLNSMAPGASNPFADFLGGDIEAPANDPFGLGSAFKKKN